MAALDMDPVIRDLWTAALRSGDYRQGRKLLRHAGRYCCLGVLTDLALKADAIPEWPAGELLLTMDVQRWARLRGPNPFLGESRAATLNDEGMSFADIADLIDGIKP